MTTLPSHPVRPRRFRRLALLLGCIPLAGFGLSTPWILRAATVRTLHAKIQADERWEDVQRTPATWHPAPDPTVPLLPLAFAEAPLFTPSVWTFTIPVEGVIKITGGECMIVFLGPFRPSSLARGPVVSPQPPGDQSSMWSDTLAFAHTVPVTLGEALAMDRHQLDLYRVRIQLKSSLYPGLIGRMTTDDIDAIISDASRADDMGLHAGIVSRQHDLSVGVYVHAPTLAEAEQIMRTLLSGFRFIDSGWTDIAQVEAEIDAAVAALQRP